MGSLFAKGDKSKSFTVERIIDASVEDVWKVVGEEFADIAKSHPVLSSSHYVEGTPMTGEGCERVCNMDDAGKKFTREKMVDYDPENHKFKVDIQEAGGLPLAPDKSYMNYAVESVGEGKSKIILTMVFQTKPAFLGGLMKGKMKQTISDYALSIAHYTTTGEEINPDNFKRIKKLYN